MNTLCSVCQGGVGWSPCKWYWQLHPNLLLSWIENWPRLQSEEQGGEERRPSMREIRRRGVGREEIIREHKTDDLMRKWRENTLTNAPVSVKNQLLWASEKSCVLSWQRRRRRLMDFPTIRICIAHKILNNNYIYRIIGTCSCVCAVLPFEQCSLV